VIRLKKKLFDKPYKGDKSVENVRARSGPSVMSDLMALVTVLPQLDLALLAPGSEGSVGLGLLLEKILIV